MLDMIKLPQIKSFMPLFLPLYRRKQIAKYLSLCLVFSLTACSNQIQQTPPTVINQSLAWLKHQQQLTQIQTYQVSGQLGYIGKKRFSTHFDWQFNSPENYRLTLSVALIGSTFSLIHTTQGLTIIDDKGKTYFDRNAHTLIKNILGIDFPLEAFPTWLKGLPSTTHYQLTNNGLLASFNYPFEGQNWQVKYLTYDHSLTPTLPEQIILKSTNQTIKIHLKQWRL